MAIKRRLHTGSNQRGLILADLFRGVFYDRRKFQFKYVMVSEKVACVTPAMNAYSLLSELSDLSDPNETFSNIF